jgi:hypothetical protein
MRATEQTFARTFAVGDQPRFALDSYRGRVLLNQGKAGEIRVEVTMVVPSEDQAKADHTFQTEEFTWKSSPDEVSVRVRDPEQTLVRLDWQSDLRVDLSYKIFVPSGCAVKLEVADGSAEIGNVTASISAEVGQGTIYIRRIEGSVRARLDLGNLVLSRCSGDADLVASFGSVQVGTVGGRATIRAPNGGIELQHALGAAMLSAVKGDVVLGLPRAPGGAVKVDVDAGSIYLKLQAGCALTIQASSVWGKVRAEVPVVVTGGGIGKRRLDATLNGGGPIATLHANGGNVKIEPETPPGPSDGSRPRRVVASP